MFFFFLGIARILFFFFIGLAVLKKYRLLQLGHCPQETRTRTINDSVFCYYPLPSNFLYYCSVSNKILINLVAEVHAEM